MTSSPCLGTPSSSSNCGSSANTLRIIASQQRVTSECHSLLPVVLNEAHGVAPKIKRVQCLKPAQPSQVFNAVVTQCQQLQPRGAWQMLQVSCLRDGVSTCGECTLNEAMLLPVRLSSRHRRSGVSLRSVMELCMAVSTSTRISL